LIQQHFCERMLGRFGGELAMENGHPGAVARVSLFAVERVGPPAQAEPSPHPRPAQIGRRRILVVDDEPLVARAIRRHLTDHDVQVVTSGREALQLLGSGEPFDTVLCDMMMPDLTGMDVYDALRERHPDIVERFLFMTGGTFTDRMRDFRMSVGNPFLDKPVQLAALRAALAEQVPAAPRRVD
jgi:CheY-like chemotaxis protein